MPRAEIWCARVLCLVFLCFPASGSLLFVSPLWGQVVPPSVSVVIENAYSECERSPCQLHLLLNQAVLHSMPLESELIAIDVHLPPGHHQLSLRVSTLQTGPVQTGPDPQLHVGFDGEIVADSVLFVVRDERDESDRRSTASAHCPAPLQSNCSFCSASRSYTCQVLQRGGMCDHAPAICHQWHNVPVETTQIVDASAAAASELEPRFWFGIDACIYSVLTITAETIAASHSQLAPRAFDLALLAATAARACPGLLNMGGWTRAVEQDTDAYWDAHAAQSDSVVFIVVSGTAFMKHRARAVRCSWAARASNVILISGKYEEFHDRCSQMANPNFPKWHAVRAAHAVSSLKKLSARALLHDDFFSSIPKFMLSLLLAWQLNPSADWYYSAGCDTAVHPAALAALLRRMDASKRLLVGGHVGVTPLLRSQLFLSGGAGLALSRAAMIALMPKIEDFTEMWLQQEGAEVKCIPCADIALQRLCEREGIEVVALDGFYAFDPAHYLGNNVLQPQFAEAFQWEQRLPQCRNALRRSIENQSFQNSLQSLDGRWGRSYSMTSPPIAFHYLGPRRLHQTWLLLQSLHMLHSKGVC